MKRLDLIAALLAVFIGALALVVSIYTAYWQRQSVRAQVWPHLALSHSNLNGFHFLVENSGMGPAEIRSVRVSLDGKNQKSWNELLAALGLPEKDVITKYLHDRVVRAGESVDVVRVVDPDAGEKLLGQLGRVQIDLCYCSVLDECWHAGGNARVASCAPNEFAQ